MCLLPVVLAGFIVTSCSTNAEQKPSESTQEEDTTVVVEVTKPSDRPTHWGYSGETGPANWGSLDPVYNLCGNGKGQSPINIQNYQVSGSANWKLNYGNSSLHIAHNEHMHEIIDNGHTIQVSVDEGSTFTFNGKDFTLKQFHFHTPSEHTIDGKNLPMEMHLVHQSEDGKLAVVSVLFKEGKTANPNLATIIANLPSKKGEELHLPGVNLQLNSHLPKDEKAFAYKGSLTTPPCSEDVQWLVLSDLFEVTPAQVKAFSDLIGPNNRPVQELNERKISTIDNQLDQN